MQRFGMPRGGKRVGQWAALTVAGVMGLLFGSQACSHKAADGGTGVAAGRGGSPRVGGDGGSAVGGRAGSGGQGGEAASGGGAAGTAVAGQSGAGGVGGVAGSGGGGGSAGQAGAGGTISELDPPANCQGLPGLKLTPVVQDLSSPVAVAMPSSAAPRLYILERAGRMRVATPGGAPGTFLDFRDSVVVQGGGGLGALGLAFHPDHANNGRFFVYYTRTGNDPHSANLGLQSADIVLAEGRRMGTDPTRAEATLTPLVTIGQMRNMAFGDHNAGGLVFGPDGFLYVGVGDGGGQGDPHGSSQDLTRPFGKILRVDVDNPTRRLPGNAAAPGHPLVWSWGLRNPWRFSFDRKTGDLYIADVGQNAWEELDFIAAGSPGRNFGWSTLEGDHCFRPAQNCDRTGTVTPVHEYATGDVVGKSITGGFVYRGKAIPCLRGRYIFGDYVSNRVFSVTVQNGTASSRVNLTADLNELPIGGLVSFAEDPDGEIYLVNFSIGGGTGRVHRIEAQ